jgi:5'-3' exonuclease
MGIPAYFSHIIKNHSKIVQKTLEPVSALLMDSNSIIYDVVHALPTEKQTDDNIIEGVIDKINSLIAVIHPTQLTYITFDGIAPYAKMDQQKQRRYKSVFLAETQKGGTKEKGLPIFNTIMITPGTPFMILLSQRIHSTFKDKRGVLISTSDEPGEGEHKLCHYLREHPFLSQNVAIYGLDADLIMLSLFHLKYTGNIYVCREKPNFVNVVAEHYSDKKDVEHEKNELLYLNIRELSHRTVSDMNCKDGNQERIVDYIFLCFFMGNDFLPSFPSLNLRTAGMDRLLDTYRQHIGCHRNRQFIGGDGNIQWKWVHLFVKELARHERVFLLQEYEVRDKWERAVHYKMEREKPSLESTVESAPLLFRQIEHYISPQQAHWENRYYSALFLPSYQIKSICTNYLEGLEWVYTYYTQGCKNTLWKYSYSYPPLLADLVSYIPIQNMVFVPTVNTVISQKEQLEYILPPCYWKEVGLVEPTQNRPPLSFAWAFKRYFWEAHLFDH